MSVAVSRATMGSAGIQRPSSVPLVAPRPLPVSPMCAGPACTMVPSGSGPVSVPTPVPLSNGAPRRATSRFFRQGGSHPDPATIKKQKEAFERDLEEVLRRGVDALSESHKRHTEQLHQSANQEKQKYNIRLDQQVKQQELMLSHEYNEQLMRLQQSAQIQRAELEQQACGLTLEYHQRKVQEEFMAQQLDIQKQHEEQQKRFAEELKRCGGEFRPGDPPGTTAGADGTPSSASAAGSAVPAPIPMPFGVMSAPAPCLVAPSTCVGQPVANFARPCSFSNPSSCSPSAVAPAAVVSGGSVCNGPSTQPCVVTARYIPQRQSSGMVKRSCTPGPTAACRVQTLR